MSSIISDPTPVIEPAASPPIPTEPPPSEPGGGGGVGGGGPSLPGGSGAGTLALTDWRILLTDLASNPIAEISDDAIEPSFVQELNGVDSMTFTLNLESQAAYQITPMKTLVKMWRDVPGYTPFPDGIPQFVGVIGTRTRNARDRSVSYTAYSPFWRLMFRYHVDPHDFSGATGKGIAVFENPGDATPLYAGYDPTLIMWEMIEYTNSLALYTLGDRTGVKIGGAMADYTGASPPVLYDVRYPVGQNTWDLVQDIVQRPGYPDIEPLYIHVEGSTDLVWFETQVHRGETKSLTLDYRMGNKNLDDVVETTQVEPGEYANYVVVQGQGDKSTGWFNQSTGFSGADQTIARADGTSYTSLPPPVGLSLPDLISEYGLYMHFDRDENATNNEVRLLKAKGLLGRMSYPGQSYEVTPSQALTWAWPYEFQAGDTLMLNIDRDSMQVRDYAVRITKVEIQRSKNKMETVKLTVVDPDSYKVYVE